MCQIAIICARPEPEIDLVASRATSESKPKLVVGGARAPLGHAAGMSQLSVHRSVLEEAERGEDAIKHGYEDALKEGSLGGITRVIGDQSVQVRRVHDEIKILRHQ